MTTELEISVTRTIPASAKATFEAWLDPAAVAKFMKPMDGMQDCPTEIDAREGGAFSIVMMAGETQIPIHGEYKTINKYSELSFTWLSSHSSPDSTVRLSFKEMGENLCELTLRHTGFASEQSRGDHERGWTRIVEVLTNSLS